MLLKLFMLTGGLFSISLFVYRIIMNKLKDYTLKSNIVVVISFFIGLYVVLGGLIFILNPTKFIYLLFALSPFIIGKFATYKYEKMYTLVQILVVAYSVIYTIGDLKLI